MRSSGAALGAFSVSERPGGAISLYSEGKAVSPEVHGHAFYDAIV